MSPMDAASVNISKMLSIGTVGTAENVRHPKVASCYGLSVLKSNILHVPYYTTIAR